MKSTSLLLSALALGTVKAAVVDTQTAAVDPQAAASKRIEVLEKQYQKYILDTIKTRERGCTNSSILVRQEWGSLSKADRLSYINAVYCLANKTAHTSTSDIPGVRNRYDDFVGAHLQRAPYVHADGLFLPFHRNFVHLYEKALREECGYHGAQPYWDWTLSYQDPRNSTVFDGSPWSMGSNGVYVPGRSPTVANFPGGFQVPFPPATGGGCVYSGPFTPDKWQLHLGPVAWDPQGPQGGFGYNPRCLSRDISPIISQDTSPVNVSSLLDGCSDLECFNVRIDSPGGVHGQGHFQMGGIALDTWASPSDPAFWLHHAQLDRVWAIWQAQAPSTRVYQVWGTQTAANVPPSDNVTLNTQINFGILSSPKAVRDVVSSIDGDLCYIYV